jgi:hypothetical protein
MTLDPTFVYANYAESCLWAGLGVAAAVKRNGPASWLLAATLVAFGISDVVEAQTGAWYEPWWLLAWKAVCILLILIFGGLVLRTQRRRPAAQDGD